MRTIVVALGALALSSCVSRAEIEEIEKNQKDILTKLDAIEKSRGAQAPTPPRRRGPDPAKTYSVALGDAPVKGPQDAWVTIVEVSDFQCPYCKRVGPTLRQIEEKYAGDVRIAFKHNALSFHQRAKPAALAAECAAEQGEFWQMHDVLFDNQRQLEDDQLRQYARQIGLDADRFETCYTSNKHAAKIDRDQREMVGLGARGTPAFFINGRFLSGAQPLPSFERLIDEELKKAKASGIARADYYQKAVVEKGQKAM